MEHARIERLHDVLVRTGLSRSTIYNMVAAGSFPPPIPIGDGRAVGWLESEVDGWIASRVARRDSLRSQHTAVQVHA